MRAINQTGLAGFTKVMVTNAKWLHLKVKSSLSQQEHISSFFRLLPPCPAPSPLHLQCQWLSLQEGGRWLKRGGFVAIYSSCNLYPKWLWIQLGSSMQRKHLFLPANQVCLRSMTVVPSIHLHVFGLQSIFTHLSFSMFPLGSWGFISKYGMEGRLLC